MCANIRTHSPRVCFNLCNCACFADRNIVYAADMPLRLPPVLLIRRLAQQCFFALIFALRAIVVGIVWLALLPWATVWTWRMYFTMGDSTYALIFSCLLIFLPDITHRAWWIS